MKEFSESRLRSRILTGTFWNFVATIAGQGSTFVVGIIVANLLKLNEYGEYAIILSTLLSLAGIVQLSIGQTVTKYVAEYRSTNVDKVGNILGLCFSVSIITALVGSVILILGAPYIAEYVLKAPHLSLPLMIGAGFLLFSVINGYQMGVLAGLEGYQSLAKAGMASAVVAIVSITIGAWQFQLTGAVLALSFSALLRFVFHYLWLRKALLKLNISPSYFQWDKEKNVLYHFAVPAAAAGFYSIPAIWLANSILVRQPNGYEQMALFSAAFSIRTLVLFIPNVFNTVGLSILNHLKGSNNHAHYKRVYGLNVLIIFLLTSLAAIVVGLFGDFSLRIFGNKFALALPVLWALLFSTIPEGLLMGLTQYLQSQEKIWLTLFAINIPRETLLVIMAFFLIPKYGALGLAYTYAIVHTFALFVIVIIIINKIRVNRNLQPSAV